VFGLFDDQWPDEYPYNSPCAASIHFDPASLDLVLVSHSDANATLLYDEGQSVPVMRWVSTGDKVIGQTILPSSNPVLCIDGAVFSFRWYPRRQSAEIYTAKKAFVLNLDPERYLTIYLPEKEIVARDLDSEYRTHVSPTHRLQPAELLKLPFDIRYCIFQQLFPPGTDDPWCGVWKDAVDDLRPYVSVRECTALLNRSYQALNPAHALDIAREAAEAFYRQKRFCLNLFDVHKFIWVLSQMNGPLDPRSMIKHVSLCIVSDKSRACAHSKASPRCCYYWTSEDTKEARDACAVVTANLPALRDVKFCIRSGGHPVKFGSDVQQIIDGIEPSVVCLTNDRKVDVRVEVSDGCRMIFEKLSAAMITSGTWREYLDEQTEGPGAFGNFSQCGSRPLSRFKDCH
jgi:hypothetical protein